MLHNQHTAASAPEVRGENCFNYTANILILCDHLMQLHIYDDPVIMM